ncbi:MAG: SWIM zinc finger family protein [Gemmatimonadaceae bacterium]
MKRTLTPDVLRELAGPAAFERGEEYAAAGRVISLAEDRARITAEVQGTETYDVELRITSGYPSYSCTCPVGQGGEFCKHCVAAALAWRQHSAPSRASKRKQKHDAVSMNDVRTHLASMPRKALVDMLVDHSMRDETLRRRLLLETAVRTPDGLNVETYRKAINGTMRTGSVVDYHAARAYARRIHDVVDSIERLLPGNAGAVIELTEHALRKLERAIGYVDDSDGGRRQARRGHGAGSVDAI